MWFPSPCPIEPPPDELLKINFDSAMFSEFNSSRAGAVISNHQGLVVASLTQKFSQAFAPMEMEALAAARVLEFAAELGITHAVLEGDSQMLIFYYVKP